MKISILIDNPGSWFHEYMPELRRILIKFDRNPRFFKCASELKKGGILFILSCDGVISRRKLKLHCNNVVVHAGDLPKNRGWSPLTWQVERGENCIPITLFEAAGKLDAGDYYIKDRIRLDGTELINDIRKKEAEKTIEMIKSYLCRYPMKAILQRGSPTYNRRRKPDDLELDIRRSIDSQFNKMRVADNFRYPLYFIRKGRKYILKIEFV